MSTFDDIYAAILIEHSKNLCAELTEPHVHRSAEFDLDDNLYTLTDTCNILYADKHHHVQLITSAEFFAKISGTNCLFGTMLDMPIDVNKMLENIFVITSSRSLNTAHSCKFTFIFIGEHVLNSFYVHAICITNDKLADLKLNMLCDNSCDTYFPNDEMNQLFSAYYSEPSMLFPCSYIPSNVRNHV